MRARRTTLLGTYPRVSLYPLAQSMKNSRTLPIGSMLPAQRGTSIACQTLSETFMDGPCCSRNFPEKAGKSGNLRGRRERLYRLSRARRAPAMPPQRERKHPAGDRRGERRDVHLPGSAARKSRAKRHADVEGITATHGDRATSRGCEVGLGKGGGVVLKQGGPARRTSGAALMRSSYSDCKWSEITGRGSASPMRSGGRGSRRWRRDGRTD